MNPVKGADETPPGDRAAPSGLGTGEADADVPRTASQTRRSMNLDDQHDACDGAESGVSTPRRSAPACPREYDSPWALTCVLAGVVAAIITTATGHWLGGSMIFAASVMDAGLLRLVLPAHCAGLLVVRRRWVDVTILLGLGAVMMFVALLVPPN